MTNRPVSIINHPCPIHPHRLEPSKSTDDSTYRKSSRRQKQISCLPEAKLMDVGVYKMLTARHDSFQQVSTWLDESRLEVAWHKSQKNLSKPKYGTRHTMLTTCHDSIRSSQLVPTSVNSTRWKSIGRSSTQVAKEPVVSKPKQGTRHTCITRSIKVCKQVIRFKRFFIARCESL